MADPQDQSAAANDPMADRFAREEADIIAAFQQPAPPPVQTQQPAIEPPVVAEPPAAPAPVAEPPVAAQPAVEPAPAPVATDPAAQPQQAAPQHPTWRQVEEQKKRAKELELEVRRERERALELERTLAADRAERDRIAREQQAQIEQPYVDEQELRMQRIEQQLQMRDTQLAETQMQMGIQQHIAAFVPSHPEYNQALSHLVESERRNREVNGDLWEREERIRANASPDQLRQIAIQASDRLGREVTQGEIVREAAVQAIVAEETQKMWRQAQRTGRNLGELVLERAQSVGWRPGNGAAPNPAAQLPSPAEQVRAEQTAAAAGNMAALSSQSVSPPPKEIETKADLAAFINGKPYAEIANYYDRRDAQDPEWLQRLR